MLLIYPPAGQAPVGDPVEQAARWQSFTDRLEEAGLSIAHGRLHDAQSATSVRVRDGETVLNDGPFAETKEYLAGFYVVECADLDQAIGLAAQMPNAGSATIEVRPLMFPVGTPPAEMVVRAQA
jgi:hypothetical protein